MVIGHGCEKWGLCGCPLEHGGAPKSIRRTGHPSSGLSHKLDPYFYSQATEVLPTWPPKILYLHKYLNCLLYHLGPFVSPAPKVCPTAPQSTAPGFTAHLSPLHHLPPPAGLPGASEFPTPVCRLLPLLLALPAPDCSHSSQVRQVRTRASHDMG